MAAPFKAIGEGLANIFGVIGDIFDFLNPFSENFFGYIIIDLLVDAIKFLFVPGQENIDALVNCVKEKFSFATTIIDNVSGLKDMLLGVDSVPTFSVHVNSTKFTNEQYLKIIDFSWYEPYKPYGDKVIASFVYVFALWRLFLSLPNIISGIGGGVVDLNTSVNTISSRNNNKGGRN